VTVVLIHGFPETPAIWRLLREHLSEYHVVELQLPGFGCAAPSNWSATKEEYLTWLNEQLSELHDEHGPLDAVGHDWGGGLLVGAVAQRPEFIRSWVCDIAGVFHPDYEWHDFARFMQLQDATEEMVVAVLSADLFSSLGIPSDVGSAIASSVDREYARCALALYRSAAQPAMVQWGTRVAGARVRSGLVLKAELDTYVGTLEQATTVASELGATVKVIPDQGHWWMLGNPVGSATLLKEFWESVAP